MSSVRSTEVKKQDTQEIFSHWESDLKPYIEGSIKRLSEVMPHLKTREQKNKLSALTAEVTELNRKALEGVPTIRLLVKRSNMIPASVDNFVKSFKSTASSFNAIPKVFHSYQSLNVFKDSYSRCARSIQECKELPGRAIADYRPRLQQLSQHMVEYDKIMKQIDSLRDDLKKWGLVEILYKVIDGYLFNLHGYFDSLSQSCATTSTAVSELSQTIQRQSDQLADMEKQLAKAVADEAVNRVRIEKEIQLVIDGKVTQLRNPALIGMAWLNCYYKQADEVYAAHTEYAKAICTFGHRVTQMAAVLNKSDAEYRDSISVQADIDALKKHLDTYRENTKGMPTTTNYMSRALERIAEIETIFNSQPVIEDWGKWLGVVKSIYHSYQETDDTKNNKAKKLKPSEQLFEQRIAHLQELLARTNKQANVVNLGAAARHLTSVGLHKPAACGMSASTSSANGVPPRPPTPFD